MCVWGGGGGGGGALIRQWQLTFWIRPQKVTHWSVVRHLLFSVNGSDLVQGGDGGRETSVDTEDL